MTALLWSLATGLPLLLAGLLLLTRPPGDRASATGRPDRPSGVHRWSVRLAQLALLPALILTLLPRDEQGTVAAVEAPWLLLGTTLGLDPVGRALLLVAVVLYAAALTAVSWRHTERAAQLEAFLLVSFVGNLGVYAATDAVTFYLAFAVMSFAAAGLVLHERTREAHRAGRVYLALTVLSETAVLGALLLVVHAGGLHLADAPAAVATTPHTGLIVALLLVGFGVKAGLMPLHVWLPLAHPAAPPAASAVLSGAMVKAGLVGWLRFLPLGEVALPTWGLTLVVLALVSAFGAVLLGIGQRDPKVVIAYSTVSQMGYLSAIVGVALAQPDLAPAAIASATVYAVHHGLAKGALFLGFPVWKHHGQGWSRRLVIAGLVVAGLAVVGAPFTSGSLGKYATKTAVEGVGLLGIDLIQLLPLVATGSTVLLIRFAWVLRRTELDPLPSRSDPELPAWLIVVATSVALPWWITAAWLPITQVPELDPVTLWDASWPILLGIALGAVVWWQAETGRRDRLQERATQIPAGDIVVLEERVLARATRATGRAGAHLGNGRDRAVEAARTGLSDLLRRAAGPVSHTLGALGSYRGSGLLIVGLIVLLVLVQEVWS
ncbi:complex I subunit 5 family protein [Ornithinimicrobium sp. Y1694]|uniref:complex I subunit 5 family protein n=1 Tax=Ornithinimicrobium sp. Y1694 TaxID=3418590 RepID=UPI003CF06604